MADLDLIMARDAAGDLRLWACRGEGKGCPRNRHRRDKAPCDDCFGPLDPDMTVEQVRRRLDAGDA